MTDIEMLATIRSQTLTLIESLTEHPKPSYSIDGQSVSWADYLTTLRATVDWCDQKLSAGEPCEERTQGYT